MERQNFFAAGKNGGNYEGKVVIISYFHADIDLWINNIDIAKNPIRESKFVLEIFSDVSRAGWGISCAERRSYGWWRDE